MSIGAMIKQNLDPAVAELAKAVEAKDAGRYKMTYDQMTAACNTCHAGAQHEFIRLQRPTSPPATNQIYAPARK